MFINQFKTIRNKSMEFYKQLKQLVKIQIVAYVDSCKYINSLSSPAFICIMMISRESLIELLIPHSINIHNALITTCTLAADNILVTCEYPGCRVIPRMLMGGCISHMALPHPLHQCHYSIVQALKLSHEEGSSSWRLSSLLHSLVELVSLFVWLGP